MAKAQPIQTSFMAGELSPLMEMRHDWEGRAQGVKEMINFFTHLQGPAETRGGSEFVWDVPGVTGRIFPFFVSTFAGFIVIVTPDYVYVSDQNGLLSKDDVIVNGDFLDGSLGWDIITVGSASVVFAGGACALSPGPIVGQDAGIRQGVVTVIGEFYQFEIQIVTGTGPMEVRVGTAEGLDNLYPATIHTGAVTIVIPTIEAVGVVIWIQCVTEGGNPTKALDKITCLHIPPSPEEVIFDSPWTTASEIASIQTEMAPGTLDLYMLSAHVQGQKLSYDKELRDWDFELWEPTNQPAEWSDANGWPSAIEFYQGRIYVGGTDAYPESFWASRPGRKDDPDGWEKYNDFLLGEDPDHAIHYEVEKRGRIRWIVGVKNLVIGTESAEHIVTSEGGVIIPGDIQTTQQSSHGSIQMQALQAGNNILFISPDGRKLRSMGYEWTKEAWTAMDLTFASEHLTKHGGQLRQVHYSANPYSIVFGDTIDGKILGCTYETSTQTAGWHRHTTHGPILSSCVLPFAGRDDLWVLVDRDAEGSYVSLERAFIGGDPEFKLIMDSYKTFSFSEPTDTLTGLEHLANMEVVIIANAAIHPPMVVEPDGTLVLEYEVMSAAVGLGYTCTFTTMARDDGMAIEGSQRGGSARPAKKRWPKIWARIIDSWKPKINGKRPPERGGDSRMNLIEPPATEDVQVTLLGYDREALITIEQDLPVNTIVGGLFGELDQESI